MDSHNYQDSPSTSSMSSSQWEDEVEYTPMSESLLPQPRINIVFYLYFTVFLVVAYFVTSWLSRRYQNYRLNCETLEKRRRYGIPDHDKRPFDIAYTAAAQRRRIEVEEKRRAEEEIEAQQGVSSSWQQLDRSTTSRFASNGYTGGTPFGKDGLVRRFPGTFQSSQSTFPASPFPSNFHNQARFHFGHLPSGLNTQGSASETLSSSISPTGPHSQPAIIRDDPSTYQDRYLPPALAQAKSAQSIRNRYRVPAPTSNLGRRSRKQLNLETDTSDANNDSETRNPSRRRLNTWGKDHGIDGDDEAKWAQPIHSEPPLPLKDMNRTRKRDGEDSNDEQNERVKPRRKIVKSAPNVPTVGTGKRKNREEDASETGEQPRRVIKQKKRVRVVTAQEQELLEKQHDEEMDEQESHDPLCEGRRIGEEWTKDGVRFKVGDDGKRLRNVLLKVKKTTLKMPRDSRHADRNMAVFEIVNKWVTEDEYAQVQKDGLLAEKSHKVGDTVTQPDPTVVSRTSPERRALQVENSSDWVDATGQTPLKSGSMRTTLGYDRAPIPSLLGGSDGPMSPVRRQQVDQTRLNHLVSPAKKAPVGGPSKLMKGGAGSGSAWSRWERKNMEAQALAKLKSQRTEVLKSAELAKPSAVSSSVSMPSFSTASTAAPPTVVVPVVPKSAEAPTLFKLGTTTAPTASTEPSKPASAAPPAPSIMVTAPSFVLPTAPKTDAAAAKPTLPAAPSGNPFANLGQRPLFGAANPAPVIPATSAEAPKPNVAPTLSITTTPATFSFGAVNSVATPATETKPALPTSVSMSALGTTNGFSSGAFNKPASSTAPLNFGFGATAAATKPTEPAKESTPAPAPAPNPFSFGGNSTTSTTTLPPSAAAASAFGGFSGTFGGNKPAGSLLFGAGPASAGTSHASDPFKPPETTKPEPPKVSVFGSGGFGNSATNGSSATSAFKPVPFSFGGNTASATSTTDTSSISQTPAPTGFGGFGALPPKPADSTKPSINIFGAAMKAATGSDGAPKPAEATKPVIFGGFGQSKPEGSEKQQPFGGFGGGGGFGSSTSAPSSAVTANGTAAKPTFSFGGNTAPAPASAFGASNSTSAFAKAASPSPFAFGSSATTNGVPASISSPSLQPFSAPASAPVFNIGTPPPTTPTTGRPAKPLPRRR